MKRLLLAMLVGLMMVGCGEEAQKEAVQEEAKDESAAPLGQNFTIPDLNLEMIWVEPGKFMMGSPPNEKGRSKSEEQHQVALTKGFYLGKHEVTQAQWQRVMGSNPSGFKGANRPVEMVSWNDAVEFCKKLTEMEKEAGRVPQGMAYQLPTEAQWEYACRAGTTTAYSWGNTTASSNANYNASGINQTRDVGQNVANPWGFFDMHGNVWELTADWFETYPTGPVTDPTYPPGAASGSPPVHRGGSWRHDGANLRSARRNYNTPSTRNDDRGFRVGFRASK